jgi:hypothetical protein
MFAGAEGKTAVEEFHYLPGLQVNIMPYPLNFYNSLIACIFWPERKP